ncbi:S24 family peptidase [Burkholderia gladioli]|uniref:S24 family peptidase n=1 Tax=Burkholderia gladioli TaxID=28095 RepID=UPI001641E4D5|nr:S24 family peptidase [Burkholderia gladioli]
MDKFERRRLRLIDVRDLLCGGAASSLAKRIGKSDSYVSRMLWPEGRNGRKRIGEDMVEQIDAAFGWPPGTFDSNTPLPGALRHAGAIDTKITSAVRADSDKQVRQSIDTDHEKNVELGPEIRGKIPLISWVQAGKWESVVDSFTADAAEAWLPSPIPTSGTAYYLRVRGLSMYNPAGEPSFNENDLVLVEPQSHVDSGALVVVLMDDNTEATFKQLIIEDGKKYLRALNPDWPNRIVQVNGNATICGVVKTKVVLY